MGMFSHDEFEGLATRDSNTVELTKEQLKEFQRLAKLGRWAEQHGIPALLETKEIGDTLEGAGAKIWDISEQALSEVPK